MDADKSDKFGIVNSGDDCKDKTIKKSLFKNSKQAISYLNPNTR